MQFLMIYFYFWLFCLFLVKKLAINLWLEILGVLGIKGDLLHFENNPPLVYICLDYFSSLKRSNETTAERSMRLEKKRNFDNFKRSNETIGERSKRLEKMRNLDSVRRSNETAAERSTRLEKKRNFESLKR